ERTSSPWWKHRMAATNRAFRGRAPAGRDVGSRAGTTLGCEDGKKDSRTTLLEAIPTGPDRLHSGQQSAGPHGRRGCHASAGRGHGKGTLAGGPSLPVSRAGRLRLHAGRANPGPWSHDGPDPAALRREHGKAPAFSAGTDCPPWDRRVLSRRAGT